MLLTVSTTHAPAGDLGYLLHKHPDRVQAFPLAFGTARVFYPESSDARCTAAILLDIDPVALVRGKGRERTLDQYVNDRPYVASSMLAVAIAQVFGTALSGICKQRPELVQTPIPLEVRIGALACGRAASSGLTLLHRLFEPLGYAAEASGRLLDESFPQWGESSVCTVSLKATVRLSDLLSHLYVLLPVLDDEKHYWVGDDEVAKLLRHGEGWLPTHPERELIARRYLKHRRNLWSDALRQLREQDGESPAAIDSESPEDPREQAVERALSLHEQRHAQILSVLQAKGARTVIDLGCGEGKLLRELVRHKPFERIVGMDVAHRALEIAAERLHLDEANERLRERLQLLHGSLLYRDARLAGFDAAVLCEVIEHLDQPRLHALERVVFEHARPQTVIVTTPNREYNVMWPELPAGSMRHADHRFEWTRDEFRTWAAAVCARFGYACEFRAVGPVGAAPDSRDVGSPTQMGVFMRGPDRP